MTATATHDTKRGEDARMRILALSELAQEWDAAVQSWREMNAPLVSQAEGKRSPSIGHEYMLYQALIGAWPGAADQDFTARMQAYALKAAREGKQETSWNSPDEAYEQALQVFVGKLLDADVSARFLESFAAFAARTALLGALNSLSQLALKALTPGVPDFYQGTELWDLSLVDPDNRRAVDFALRRRELAGGTQDWRGLAAHWPDGRVKLALTRALLRLRHDFDDLFQYGSYEALAVTGAHAEHVIAFARTLKRQRLVIAIGRHFCPLTDAGRQWPSQWEGAVARDNAGPYEYLIGSEPRLRTHTLPLAELFRDLPVSVLRRV